MESAASPVVAIVANRTAATPALSAAVRERAAAGPVKFILLVPHVRGDQSQPVTQAEQMLALSLPLIEEAAGAQVEGIIVDPDPLQAIEDAIRLRGISEVILSTLPTRVSRWLRLDLPRKVEALGLAVTTVVAKERGGPPAPALPAEER
jgi:hypothetical protein